LAYVRIDVAIPSPAHQIVAWESRSSRMKTVSTSPWSSDHSPTAAPPNRRPVREGRVLLAGDAALVHSSASGQGMNTCIQDAYALGALLAGGRIGAMH
jgi:2-polyprenyl-6-methoxyphenol hydroxylase-like FAD-dependent oxidoreductase